MNFISNQKLKYGFEVTQIGPYFLNRPWSICRDELRYSVEAKDLLGKPYFLKLLYLESNLQLAGIRSRSYLNEFFIHKSYSAISTNICSPVTLDIAVSINGSHQGNIYYMAYELGSRTLQQRKRNFIARDQLLMYLDQVKAGVLDLHTIGIAHQDLNPSNILILPPGTAKICDLGNSFSLNHKLHCDLSLNPCEISHSPPELFYSDITCLTFLDRCSIDFYLLASLYFTAFIGRSLTSVIINNCNSTERREIEAAIEYKDAIPILRRPTEWGLLQLFDRLTPLPESIDSNYLFTSLASWTNPDPNQRRRA